MERVLLILSRLSQNNCQSLNFYHALVHFIQYMTIYLHLLCNIFSPRMRVFLFFCLGSPQIFFFFFFFLAIIHIKYLHGLGRNFSDPVSALFISIQCERLRTCQSHSQISCLYFIADTIPLKEDFWHPHTFQAPPQSPRRSIVLLKPIKTIPSYLPMIPLSLGVLARGV